ncbi:MAG: ScyD/ScyE family protein [Synechococcaceae cyanobacterium]
MGLHAAGALLGLLSPLLMASAQANPAYRQRLLASGLANPRGLLVQEHRVLVSEAGSGAAAGSGGGTCIVGGAGSSLCAGPTGAIGAWDRLTNSYSRLVAGLPSLAQSDGSEGTGIADFTWHDSIGLVGVFGLGGDPRQPAVSLLSPLFGQVVSIDLATGQLTPRSNLAAYEKTLNPDGPTGDVNSNPYAIQSFAGKLFATDAGGNTLLTIEPASTGPDGNFTISNHVVFPKLDVTLGPPFRATPIPYLASAVPTGLTVNQLSDKLQIGEFSGFPFEAGSAAVLSLAAAATTPVQALTGFSLITDVAAGADGSLYVLEYASDFFNPVGGGSLWHINTRGDRSQIITGLTQPAGLAVHPSGIIYIANNADGTEGQLLQFDPVPGPSPLLGAGVAWSRSRHLRRLLRQFPRGGSR